MFFDYFCLINSELKSQDSKNYKDFCNNKYRLKNVNCINRHKNIDRDANETQKEVKIQHHLKRVKQQLAKLFCPKNKKNNTSSHIDKHVGQLKQHLQTWISNKQANKQQDELVNDINENDILSNNEINIINLFFQNKKLDIDGNIDIGLNMNTHEIQNSSTCNEYSDDNVDDVKSGGSSIINRAMSVVDGYDLSVRRGNTNSPNFNTSNTSLRFSNYDLDVTSSNGILSRNLGPATITQDFDDVAEYINAAQNYREALRRIGKNGKELKRYFCNFQRHLMFANNNGDESNSLNNSGNESSFLVHNRVNEVNIERWTWAEVVTWLSMEGGVGKNGRKNAFDIFATVFYEFEINGQELSHLTASQIAVLVKKIYPSMNISDGLNDTGIAQWKYKKVEIDTSRIDNDDIDDLVFKIRKLRVGNLFKNVYRTYWNEICRISTKSHLDYKMKEIISKSNSKHSNKIDSNEISKLKIIHDIAVDIVEIFKILRCTHYNGPFCFWKREAIFFNKIDNYCACLLLYDTSNKNNNKNNKNNNHLDFAQLETLFRIYYPNYLVDKTTNSTSLNVVYASSSNEIREKNSSLMSGGMIAKIEDANEDSVEINYQASDNEHDNDEKQLELLEEEKQMFDTRITTPAELASTFGVELQEINKLKQRPSSQTITDFTVDYHLNRGISDEDVHYNNQPKPNNENKERNREQYMDTDSSIRGLLFFLCFLFLVFFLDCFV